MHAQTTTAQAPEATPIRAAKAKRAALTVVLPGETLVQAAIRAAETYRREVMEPLGKAHTATEDAGVAARRALEAVPFPAELVVPRKSKITDAPLTRVVAMTYRHPDGREIVQEISRDRTERLESREAIIDYFGDDHPDLGERLAAFDSWEAQTAPLRKALDEAVAKEAKADRVWQRSYNKNDELCRAILRAPAEPHEAAEQVEAYARLLSSCSGKNVNPSQITFDEDAAPAIEFMHQALKRVAAMTPPPASALTDPAIDYDLLQAVSSQMFLRGQQRAATKDGKYDEAEEHTEAMQPVLDTAMALRAKTLAGLMGRVWLVEDWAPKAESLTGQDLEWKIVRSLLDDIKALYTAQEPQALIGSQAVTAGLIAAGLAQRCGVVGKPALSKPSAWDIAVARREQIRREHAEYQDRESRDVTPAMNEEWEAAEAAFYTTPAPDFAAVLTKMADNLSAEDPAHDRIDCTESVDELVERLATSGDLNDACWGNVYRDIQRLAGLEGFTPAMAPSDPLAPPLLAAE